MIRPAFNISEHRDLLVRARDFSGDDRFGSANFRDVHALRDILKQLVRKRRLSDKQLSYLGGICDKFEKIKDLNDGFEDGMRDYTVGLLGDVVDLARSYDASKGRRAYITKDRNDIKRGVYFWHYHFDTANILLKEVKSENRDTCGLDNKVSDMIGRTYIQFR